MRWAGGAAQAQTAECLVVGEIATQRLLVVLNKVDLLPAAERSKLVVRARRRLAQTLASTKFAGCPMVAVAAKPGARGCSKPGTRVPRYEHSCSLEARRGTVWHGAVWLIATILCLLWRACYVPQRRDVDAVRVVRTCDMRHAVHTGGAHRVVHFLWATATAHVGAGGGEGARVGEAEGVAALVDALVATVPPEPRRPGGPFLLAVDHCFSMRGQGTVLTGTVLAGSLQVPPLRSCPALCTFERRCSLWGVCGCRCSGRACCLRQHAGWAQSMPSRGGGYPAVDALV